MASLKSFKSQSPRFWTTPKVQKDISTLTTELRQRMANYVRPSPRDPEHSHILFSNERIKSMSKQKIQEYIESFFSAIGTNRNLLGTVSPSSLTYNIDRSFDPKTDPSQ